MWDRDLRLRCSYYHCKASLAVLQRIEYNVNITMRSKTGAKSGTSDPFKDFFTLPRRNRAARLLPSLWLPKPRKVTVDGDGYLAWKWYGDEQGGGVAPVLQKPPATLCFRFAQLADGSNDQIRRFTEKWGLLGLDPHAEQHVDHWRKYARIARAILRFASAQLTGGRGKEEDWTTLGEWVNPSTGLGKLNRDPKVRMAVLGLAVNKWFSQARGHFIMDITPDGQLQVRPSASNLFGILGTQMAHVIARSDQAAVCAGCQNPFPPERPLCRGSRQYCKRCRKKKVPQRDASRDWRRRAALKNQR